MAKGLRKALVKHQAKVSKLDRAKALQALQTLQRTKAKQKAIEGNRQRPRNKMKKAVKKHSNSIVPFNQHDSVLLLGEGTRSPLYRSHH